MANVGQVLVDDAIETINPLKITVRSKPIAIGSAHGDGRFSLHQLVRMLEADGEDCILVHPCRQPELFGYQSSGLKGGEGWFHVVGIAWLDVADKATYDALRAAMEDRREQFGSDVSYIEF